MLLKYAVKTWILRNKLKINSLITRFEPIFRLMFNKFIQAENSRAFLEILALIFVKIFPDFKIVGKTCFPNLIRLISFVRKASKIWKRNISNLFYVFKKNFSNLITCFVALKELISHQEKTNFRIRLCKSLITKNTYFVLLCSSRSNQLDDYLKSVLFYISIQIISYLVRV